MRASQNVNLRMLSILCDASNSPETGTCFSYSNLAVSWCRCGWSSGSEASIPIKCAMSSGERKGRIVDPACWRAMRMLSMPRWRLMANDQCAPLADLTSVTCQRVSETRPNGCPENTKYRIQRENTEYNGRPEEWGVFRVGWMRQKMQNTKYKIQNADSRHNRKMFASRKEGTGLSALKMRVF